MTFALKERVRFKPAKGAVREGVVMPGFVDTGKVKVQLDGDPFPVDLKASQVSSCNPERKVLKSEKKAPNVGRRNKQKEMKMPSEAKELRQKAKALAIEGWEDMGRSEMRKAIKRAEKEKASGGKSKPKAKTTKPAAEPEKPKAKAKSTTKAMAAPAKEKPAAKAAKPAAKKAAAKKAPAKAAPASGSDEALGLSFAAGATPKDLPAEGENPFRKSSNLFLVAKLLLQGGTRSSLAKKLSEKVDLHPYHKGADEVSMIDYDKRLLLGAQTMRDQYGYGIQRVGRGIEGKILVFRPGGDKDPRNKAKSKSKK